MPRYDKETLRIFEHLDKTPVRQTLTKFAANAGIKLDRVIEAAHGAGLKPVRQLPGREAEFDSAELQRACILANVVPIKTVNHVSIKGA